MLHSVLGWIAAAALLVVASLVVNAVLVVLKFGNIKTALFLRS